MDLDFFVHPAWRPRIRPATAKREWMENTPERFAYRCLPLAIANAHGWEVGSPCGFEARWNGGSGADSVEVRLDPGVEPRQAPVSLFGQGTVTFHVEAIVRTSPGWNLWVGGSPNGAKDGLAPLGAVIETDWSPYTFTMNWRFTRPDHWVRFEEDEPFCFFFPVRRGELDAVKPRFRALDEEPELRDAFASWSESRNAFQAWVEATRPTAPADRWQKLYYRGVNPDGSAGAADHQSKLRLAVPTGAEGVACPVTGTRAARPGTRAGSSPVTAQPEPRTGTKAPPRAASGPANATADQALRHREWLLAVTERQRELSTATAGIAWVSDLSSDEFLDNFYATCRPALIEGALTAGLDRWAPEYLVDHAGDEDVVVCVKRTGQSEAGRDERQQVLPLRRFVELAAGAPAADVPIAYDCDSIHNADALAPLQPRADTLDTFLAPGPGILRLSQEGTFTPLHYERSNHFLLQLAGRQRLFLLPPSETGKLYNRDGTSSAVIDITDPAGHKRFPLVAEARASEVVLSPGDALFLPVGWWVQAHAEAFSVTASYTNFIWPNVAEHGGSGE